MPQLRAEGPTADHSDSSRLSRSNDRPWFTGKHVGDGTDFLWETLCPRFFEKDGRTTSDARAENPAEVTGWREKMGFGTS